MPGTEELMARLQRLEDGYYGDREAARQQSFFDTYGSRFSNNRGLGLAILNELDARGIDTSAADEAVQQILDQLRTECQEILDLTKQANEAAIQNAQKVEEIANVVSEAVASNPEATSADLGTMPDAQGAELPPGMETMNPDGEFNPDEMGGGEEQPPAEEPPAEEPAAGEQPPAEEQLPPEQTVSDARMKRVNRMKAKWGETRAQRKAKSGGFKPTAGMIEAASKGY